VLEFVQGLDKENGIENIIEDKGAYSQHWWFDFQNRNPDIKKLWKRLPLERSRSKYNTKAKKLKAEDSPEIQREVEIRIKVEGCKEEEIEVEIKADGCKKEETEVKTEMKIEECKKEEPCQPSQIHYKHEELQNYLPMMNAGYPIESLNHIYDHYLLASYFNHFPIQQTQDRDVVLQNFSQSFRI